MKLTNSSIASLSCPTGKAEITYFCSELPGFGYRIRASGVKRWVVQYEMHGKTKRITIGRPETFTAEEARRIARQTLAKVRLGQDPAAEKSDAKLAAKLTLGSVADEFLADRESKLRPSSMVPLRRYLLRWWKPLHGKPLSAITRKDIATHLSGAGAGAADGALRLGHEAGFG